MRWIDPHVGTYPLAIWLERLQDQFMKSFKFYWPIVLGIVVLSWTTKVTFKWYCIEKEITSYFKAINIIFENATEFESGDKSLSFRRYSLTRQGY